MRILVLQLVVMVVLAFVGSVSLLLLVAVFMRGGRADDDR